MLQLLPHTVFFVLVENIKILLGPLHAKIVQLEQPVVLKDKTRLIPACIAKPAR